ncbi:MAG: histone deacetylase [Actinobacteria bacterium]|nr:histone deacetylase [Actinomycetota bacterium]MCI0543942.1 histone deacetylase [Actinomycetota bacterium]
MKVVMATHPSALEHDTGDLHPERPQRITAAVNGVHLSGLEVVDLEAPRIDRSLLTMVHDPGYVDAIETLCHMGGGALDFDTRVSEASWEAALRSAGAVQCLVEELEKASSATGFAVTRPPGHHALADRGMGFCVFNNVAVTTAWLRHRGLRVAILDWDVHHGNGTQAMVISDPGVLYVSLHQDPFYPYEGMVDDIELGAPGTTINLPLPEGTAGDIVREAFSRVIIPVLGQFQPDWILVSAGFDAHVADPLARLALTAEDYGWMAGCLTEIQPPERLVFALEGGYDLGALESSVAATLSGVAGADHPPSGLVSPATSSQALSRVVAAVGRHWEL